MPGRAETTPTAATGYRGANASWEDFPISDTRNAAFEFVRALSSELASGDLELPAFPDVAIRVRNALEDPNVAADQVARLVAAEPVLAARLIKIANSALVSGRSGDGVKDIRTAVTRLGFSMVRNTAITLAMSQTMGGQSNAELKTRLGELWQHSIRVGAIAYVIARTNRRLSADEAMLAGLLHDIGKIYILQRAERHPELFAAGEAFEHIVGDWHTGVGSAILLGWKFSPEMVAVAEEHEQLERITRADADLVDVVLVANLLANDDQEGEGISEWAALPAVQRLQLADNSAAAILADSRDRLESIINALQGAG